MSEPLDFRSMCLTVHHSTLNYSNIDYAGYDSIPGGKWATPSPCETGQSRDFSAAKIGVWECGIE
jgi:hypothetical protein